MIEMITLTKKVYICDKSFWGIALRNTDLINAKFGKLRFPKADFSDAIGYLAVPGAEAQQGLSSID